MKKEHPVIPLSQAVETIKTAILQGQYEALKEVNRVQLAVYYAIGKFLSRNTRKGVWGTSALKQISNQLRKELPGLRGYSEANLKNMRLFYEQWIQLDSNSSVTTDELLRAANQTDTLHTHKSSVITDDLYPLDNQINIYQSLTIPNMAGFPIDDFFKVPFTHHIEIFKHVRSMPARYYYIHRTAEEHLSVESLERLIRQKAFENRECLPNNFAQTISDSFMARKAVMMFKDSYALQFINTEEIGERDKQDIDEKVIEQKIVQNIKNFIMTFGNDFSFVGNQYHLEIYDEEFFPDLVFFNRELNALVVVELKMGDFKPSYLGQLCFILLAVGEQNKTLFIELTSQQSFLFRAFFYFKFNIPIFYRYR
ncbi:MAG: DUF1016 family protein [Paludibacteraceae bacterium]|nr:DUF1016 family protein [Paludibacteraceae bacterium]